MQNLPNKATVTLTVEELKNLIIVEKSNTAYEVCKQIATIVSNKQELTMDSDTLHTYLWFNHIKHKYEIRRHR